MGTRNHRIKFVIFSVFLILISSSFKIKECCIAKRMKINTTVVYVFNDNMKGGKTFIYDSKSKTLKDFYGLRNFNSQIIRKHPFLINCIGSDTLYNVSIFEEDSTNNIEKTFALLRRSSEFGYPTIDSPFFHKRISDSTLCIVFHLKAEVIMYNNISDEFGGRLFYVLTRINKVTEEKNRKILKNYKKIKTSSVELHYLDE